MDRLIIHGNLSTKLAIIPSDVSDTLLIIVGDEDSGVMPPKLENTFIDRESARLLRDWLIAWLDSKS